MNTAVKVSEDTGKSLGGRLSVGAIAAGTAIGNLASKVVTLGAHLIGDGIGKIGQFVTESTQKAMEAQQTAAQLDAVLKSTGGSAGVTRDAALELADSLSKVTRNADDEILSGQNMLLTFTNIGKDIFPGVTKTMLDMATAMNGGMRPSAEQLRNTAIQLGKAFNDPVSGVTALQRVGVKLTEAQKQQIKGFMAVNDMASAQKVILAELQTEFGGSAEASAKTAAGQADIMRNSFEKMQESIGGTVLTIQNKLMETFGPTIITLLQGFSDFISSPAFAGGIDAIGSALSALGGIVSGLAAGGDPFGVITNGLYNMLTALGMNRGEAATWATGIASFVQTVITLFQSAVAWVQTNWPAIEAAVTPVINAIIGAIAGVVNWVVANWPQIQSYITGVFEQARPIVEAAINYVSTIVTTVFGAISQFLAENGGDIQNFIGTAWGSIQEIISGVLTVLQLTIVPIWNAIAKFISDNQDTIKAVIELVWNNIKMTISVVLDVIKGIINVFIKILKGDWQGAWDTIKETAVNVWNDIKAFFDNIPSQLVTVGKNIIDGIVKGLIAAQDQVTAALQKIINDAITSIKQMLGIQSPSTVFAGIGANMMMGLANGINGYGALPNVQLNGVVNGLASAATTPADTGATSGGAPITVQVVMDSQVITENVYRRLDGVYYSDTAGQWGGVH